MSDTLEPMFIIEVIPIGRGVMRESLSYFSHISYTRGTLLQIPVRQRSIYAIVTSAIEASSMKTALRAATFSLRKLPTQHTAQYFSPAFLETAEKTADYHGIPLSAVLYGMLPKEMREGTIPLTLSHKEEEYIPPPDSKPRIFAAPYRDRANEYDRLVRELFAAKKSVVFVVPTLEYIEQYKEKLSKGIEAYTVILAGGKSASTLSKIYETIATEAHPLLILTTPHYGCIERPDIGAYIIEHERSNGYVGKMRPHLDYRFILSTYAACRGITCILADTIVRSEEVYAVETGKALPFIETLRRLELPGTFSVIMQGVDKDAPFTLLSPALQEEIDHALKQKKRIFLFCARRGLAPLIVCVDCGHILRDPESGSPLSLIRTGTGDTEKRWFISSVSGYRIAASDLCPLCGSWRLKERGIGIQQVYDELVKHYDREKIILLDHQTGSTQKKANALRTAFYTQKGGILLGTALAIPYLTQPVNMSAVISMDSLRALPSWRSTEESFNILMQLREKTNGPVIVQTRTEDEIFEHVRYGTVGDFYAQELLVRKECMYPPYCVFVHLAWKTMGKDTGEVKKMLATLFAEESISLYSAPYAEQGPIQYGLMRIPPEAWPNESLATRLRTLPPQIRVMINPDRII